MAIDEARMAISDKHANVDNIPQRIDAIVVSTQHDAFDKDDNAMLEKIKHDIKRR